MIFDVYCYRDIKVGFMQPVIENNEGSAVRGFSYALKNGLMNYAPQDFQLYRIGKFDADKGTIEPEPMPVLITEGVDCVD